MKAGHLQIPPAILRRLRAICSRLPEAREEAAWVGVRWRIGTRTFAHVLMVDRGWPPAYAKAAGADGPLCLLTLRSSFAAFDPDSFTQPPFFRPRWWPDIIGVTLEGAVDWAEIRSLVVASYRALAPKRLTAPPKAPPTK